MNSKAWITLIGVSIVLIAVAMVALIVFMPQSKALVETDAENYENISKYDYTAVIDKDRSGNQESFNVTESIVKEGKTSNSYVPGNSNPFTPKSDITIYNEPSASSGSGSSKISSNTGTKIITTQQTK